MPVYEIDKAAGAPILVADSQPNDIGLLRLAFERVGLKNPIYAAGTGAEALDYLHGRDKFGDRQRFPFPKLMLLETQLPLVPGLAVLAEIRRTVGLCHLPVIVLADATGKDLVERARLAGANSLLFKPFTLEGLRRTVKGLSAFWLETCLLPDGAQGSCEAGAVRV